MDEKDDKGFTIRDRRTAGEEGSDEQPGPQQEKAEQAEPGRPDEAAKEGPLPEIDFSTFILSLATTAQMNMGNVPQPGKEKQEPNLPAAKQMIDILGLLKEKTEGNLNEEEQGLLDNLLYSLRMLFLKAASGGK